MSSIEKKLTKPPPLLPGEKSKMSFQMETRKDVRLSKDHDRYSFDVDVAGPFISKVDPKKRKPRMRNVATNVMLMDDVTQDMPVLVDGASQTELDFWSDDGQERKSKGSYSSGRRSRGHSFGSHNEEAVQEGAGDASSSSHASESEKEKGEDDESGKEDANRKRPSGKSVKSGKSGKSGKSVKSGKSGKTGTTTSGKTLERKESKRREAETMVRPRGYRELNLNERATNVCFEVETSVTGHDLDKEVAKQRGHSLPKDNILWPTCEEFDIDRGVKKIEDYIKTCWNLDSKWLFVTQPLEVYHDNYRKKYVFEVKFSIPSPTTPVPPATASVFFVFEIPLYFARDDPVSITYVLEGTRFPYKPGRIAFQEKWLHGIISDKIRLQKLTNF